MNIEDVKIGMKVKLISTKVTGEYLGYNSTEMLRIGGTGLVDEIFEDGEKHPHVCLNDGYYYDVLDLELCLEDSLSKLTVTISDEDKEEIAKDILKIVLNDLNVIITDAIDNLSDGVESNEPQNFFSYYGLSDEELRKIMDEVTEDLMKDCVDLNNTESSSMQTDTNVVTEDSILTNLLALIEKATVDGDLESLLNLTTAYQRMKSASTI